MRLTLSEPGIGGPPVPGARDLLDSMRSGDAGAWPNWRPEELDPEEIEAAWTRALSRRGTPGSPRTLHVYTHFAYCEMSCKFCMYFHRVPKDAAPLDAYAEYLVRRFEERRQAQGVIRATHAYCGGGTPSALPLTALGRFFEAFSRTIRVAGDFTFEAHPITLDEDKLRLAARHGVNRVSMGIQSLQPEILRLIARKNPPTARIGELTRRAQELGIVVNLDLLLGLPGQTPSSLGEDVRRVMELGPDTITVYRYQPVARLPGEIDASLRFSTVFDAKMRLHVLSKGYLPAVPDRDDAYGAKLVRVGRRIARPALRALRARASRLWDPGAEATQYSSFSAPRSHVMGFGPGAFSHVYGEAWYYDRTTLDRVSVGGGPELTGTRLDVEDEWRNLVLDALAKNDFTSPALARRLDSVDLARLIDLPRHALALEQRGERFRFHPNAPPAERERVIEALLPARASASKATEDPATPGGVAELCALLGINVGSRVGADGWLVSARTPSQIEFRREDPRATLLLVVERAGSDRPRYHTAHGLALRYVGDRLRDTEQAFLDSLCASLDSL